MTRQKNTFKYRVSALNAGGASATSAVSSVTTLLASPAGFTATPSSATQVDLAWTAVTHATTYKIERSTDNGTTWTATRSPT